MSIQNIANVRDFQSFKADWDNRNKFIPVADAIQIGGSNIRYIVQGFDPDQCQNNQGAIDERVFQISAPETTAPKTLRADFRTLQEILHFTSGLAKQYIEGHPDLRNREVNFTRVYEMAGFPYTSANSKQVSDSAQTKPQPSDFHHWYYLPNAKPGNTEGYDPEFFNISDFMRGSTPSFTRHIFIANPNEEIEYVQNRINNPNSKAGLRAISINDGQAGSRGVASVFGKEHFNNVHVILGTGANIFVGRNYSSRDSRYLDAEINTEYGHREPFPAGNRDVYFAALDGWRLEKGLKVTFEELFAGGNIDGPEAQRTPWRGLMGQVRHIQNLVRTNDDTKLTELCRILNCESDLRLEDNRESLTPEVIKTSSLTQLQDTDITPQRIRAEASKNDPLARRLMSIYGERLANALLAMHKKDLEDADVVSIHGGFGINIFKDSADARHSFNTVMHEFLKDKWSYDPSTGYNTGSATNPTNKLYLSKPDYNMDGLAEYTREEAAKSIIYKAALARTTST